MMKMIYITLNNEAEAEQVGRHLLERKLANCVNYFPITCIYNYNDEIVKEPEVVLIVKTHAEKYDDVVQAIQQFIDYDNFIGQLEVSKVNDAFATWLNQVVPH